MTSKERVLQRERDRGRMAALALQDKAPAMTGTEIIAQEDHVPAWDAKKDYTGWAAGYPVADEGQVWVLLQPHNAAHYTGRPSTLRALWGLAHTTDPANAKPWVAPFGTSGLYMAGECCTENGGTYRSTQDNNAYSPSAYPANWEQVNA